MGTKAENQAIFMDYLLEKAKKDVANTPKAPPSFLFDPQGRLLVDIKLTVEDYAKIEILPVINDKEALRKALGLQSLSDTTTVSLDVKDVGLEEAFTNQLKAAFKQEGLNDESSSKVITALINEPKGSIIALQQEMHFHLGLASQVYQDLILKESGTDLTVPIEKAHQAAMVRVNTLVMAAYAKALIKASNNEKREVSLSNLNKALDKARKEIAPKAHDYLVEEMLKAEINLQGIPIDEFKKKAEETPACRKNFLHLDPDSGLATFIEVSDHTAHHRAKGALATRRIITANYTGGQDGEKIKAIDHSRIQIRTPSLDVKKEISEKESIEDIKIKLKTIAEDYQLRDALSNPSDKIPRAFVYNLHTALEHTVDDVRGGNLQSQGAKRILQGAHQYNAAQLHNAAQLPEKSPVFCLVQNISVNGFGKSLSQRNRSPLVKEAALMSELAMLHTLYNSVSKPELKLQIGDAFNHYKTYLTSSNREIYFSKSSRGKTCLDEINKIKTAIKTEITKTETTISVKNSPEKIKLQKIQAALLQIFANNLHEDHQYAKLTQALSIFLENASIAGCKSGNERAQAVNGRVAILDAFVSGKLEVEGKEIKPALDNLFTATGKEIPKKMKCLNDAIDSAYNKHGLQGAPAVISLMDQGASAKVNPNVGGFNTNNAEAPKSIMTNLWQHFAGKMQAHKGLPKFMKASVEEALNTREKLNVLKSECTRLIDLQERHPNFFDSSTHNSVIKLNEQIDLAIKAPLGESKSDTEAVYNTIASSLNEFKSLLRSHLHYNSAAVGGNQRTHKFEATTDGFIDQADLKNNLQAMRGDQLKTEILIHFKENINLCTNAGQITEYVNKFKLGDEFKILDTAQGSVMRGAHKLGFKFYVKTDSVKAMDKMIEEAIKNVNKETGDGDSASGPTGS
jgi:copper chaperone CopZ